MTSQKVEIKIKIGEKFGEHREWKVKKHLNHGGFGHIYLVKNKKTGLLAAMKVEPDDPKNGGAAIKIETQILKNELFRSMARKDYHYMIITRLGKDLRELRLERTQRSRFNDSTCVRVGIQCLYAMKLLHDVGFIHRDIKPVNFMTGHYTDVERCRTVHLVDFGLARRFARQDKSGNWLMRRARKTANFRGTLRYCAPSMHDYSEQGRREDIWSWLYMLLELHSGLPWEKEVSRERIEWKKLKIKDEALLKDFPQEMHWILRHLRYDLDCYKRPDYAKIYECCENWMKKAKATPEEIYDWEKPHEVKTSKKPIAWTHPKTFFTADPLRLDGPPAAGEDSPPSSDYAL